MWFVLQVWDANRLDVVADFKLEARVYAIAMSRVATAHCLIAAAGTDPQVSAVLYISKCYGQLGGRVSVAFQPQKNSNEHLKTCLHGR